MFRKYRKKLLEQSIPTKPSYELIYFDVRGRAELARCVFAAAGQAFTDTRLTQEQWEAMKGDTKYGQLPELRIDGKVLCQSNSIARFLAKEFGLAGKDNFENGQIDMYVDMCNELFQQFVFTFFIKDEAGKKELQKKLQVETIPKFIGFIERDLANNGRNYLVGNSLSLADIAVQDLLDVLFQKIPVPMKKNDFQKLKAHRDTLLSIPHLGEYLKNRKQKVL